MSLAQALSTYGTLNLLVVIASISLALSAFVLRKLNYNFSSRSALELHYTSLILIFVIITLQAFIPGKSVFQPAAKVWSAQSFKTFAQNITHPGNDGILSFSMSPSTTVFDAHKVVLVWIALGIVIFLLGTLRIGADLLSLHRIRRKSFLIKKIGKVSIFTNNEMSVPFSYYFFNNANVVIPSGLLECKEDYRIALSHELQHHRQRDTIWIYPLWCLRLICAPNPFIHLWSRSLSEIQEFACDETLVDQRKVKSQAYARCLVEVAQTAIGQKRIPVCATGLTFLVEGNLLKRRIEKMLSQTKIQKGRSIRVALGVFLLAIMVGTAYASKGLVQDRRVTMEQAQEMARTTADDGFPIVVNDLVLKQLNRYIGTPEGREFIKDSLARMENYRTSIETKLTQYKVPTELLAIPIVESGYQNLPESNKVGWGAGLWMFIKPTAKIYGLTVNDQTDQRMNTDLETDAAMRLLSADHLRFQDWQLSVLAYNMGEGNLQKGIDATGSKDAWTLIRAGYEGDKDYLARVMAAVLIVKNPSSIQ